jgi:hypothetical protein
MAEEQFYTYDGSGNRVVEAKGDIADVIANIDRFGHPLLTLFMGQKAGDINPKIVEDTLAGPSTSNAHGEGDAAPASVDTTRSLIENFCQLYMTTASVSDTKNAIDQYGIATEFLYQKGKKLKEVMRDGESIMVGDQAQQAPTAANSRVGLSKGVSTFIATHTSATFSEANLDAMLIDIWESGGAPTEILLTGAHKQAMEGFTTNVTVETPSPLHRRDDMVSTYQGSVGPPLNVTPHYLLPQDIVTAGAEVLVIQPSLWVVKELLPIYWKDLPDNGPGPSGVWRWQWAVLAKAEQGNGMFTG